MDINAVVTLTSGTEKRLQLATFCSGFEEINKKMRENAVVADADVQRQMSRTPGRAGVAADVCSSVSDISVA